MGVAALAEPEALAIHLEDVDVAGRPVEEPIDSGLIGQAGTALYPVRHEIPVLLQEEAIPLDQIGE